MYAMGMYEQASDPLELEFQAVVSLLTWMLGTELGFSGKTVSLKPLSHQPRPITDVSNSSVGS